MSERYVDRAIALAVLLPFLKYPANPPGVGDPDTPARRQLLYVGCLLWQFRAASLGGQVLFWATFSSLFAVLLERAARETAAPLATR